MSLLNISFKLHTLAPCPNAPRKLPQSSSSPELRCGLPGVNNPRRSEHLCCRLWPHRPWGHRLPQACQERPMQPDGLPTPTAPGSSPGEEGEGGEDPAARFSRLRSRHTDATWQRGGWGGGCSRTAKVCPELWPERV